MRTLLLSTRGANRVVNADKLQVRVGLPPGSIVKLDKVTLGVLMNFHGLSGL
jgi:hypothetical protein